MNALLNSLACAKLDLWRKGDSIHLSRHPSIQASKALALILGILAIPGLHRAYGKTNDFSSCFISGEVSKYKVSWIGLPLAWSRTSIDTITENGRELIRFRMVVENYKAYSYIYKVDDVTEVVIDPKTALPLRLDVILNEGSIQKSHLTTFYHDQGVAVFQDRISKDIREVPIESGTRDIYSFLYSARNRDLATLASQEHTLFVDGKLYELGLKIRKERKIKLPGYGKVECDQIEPIAEFDGIFLRKGKIMFWVSKQNRRMVTCIKAKVAVGKITVKLQEVSGPGDDFWINKKK
ncbi:MAG: hypothetical protein DRP64_12095 [Verrucomicrobia bacterium]|nr:MAG: hypothetical protein DRP64_12095 [Verrucomicrobiota bacterium]